MQGKESVVITTTLPLDIYKRIETRAAAAHTSRAAVIRHAVCEFFAVDKRLHDESHG
jgi:hypothetical protein